MRSEVIHVSIVATRFGCERFRVEKLNSRKQWACQPLGMPLNRSVFSQVMDRVHPELFRRCVDRYAGNYKTSSFSCWDQFLAMAFAQLTYRQSLADLETCLRARPDQLYHLGFRSSVAHSTLADANLKRDWRIYAELAQSLIRRARRLYSGDPLDAEIAETVYAFDSTTVQLCLSLFPWAKFRTSKGAIKLHTLIDVRGAVPTMITISEGKMADVRALDELVIEPGACYVMDRGYLDFARLRVMAEAGAFFVTRTKAGVLFSRQESMPVDKSTGVRSDHVVVLVTAASIKNYPERMRRVAYRDPEDGKVLVFLTNNFVLPAFKIAAIYKLRWRVELFFKWIKQNLRIKHFFGTSENAVKTQIWIAVCVYLLVAILRKELGVEMSSSQILQILSVTPFEQVPLNELLAKVQSRNIPIPPSNQLMLWQ